MIKSRSTSAPNVSIYINFMYIKYNIAFAVINGVCMITQ